MLILVALAVAMSWFTWTSTIRPTRKCKKCKGAKFVGHRGWAHRGCRVVCPRCGGRGRELRLAARALHPQRGDGEAQRYLARKRQR